MGAVLVELPAGWKRSNVPPAGKGKEGEERGASPAALRRQTPEGQEARAHCKGTACLAQTNWLMWQPGEVVHSLTDLRRRQKQSLRKLLARPSDFGGLPPTTSGIYLTEIYYSFIPLRNKHTVSGISPTAALAKVRALFSKEVVNY